MHIHNDTLLLVVDVFDNFQNARFLTALGLAWEAVLKKYKVKLDLLTDLDILLMVEKGIRRGICQRYSLICKSYK